MEKKFRLVILTSILVSLFVSLMVSVSLYASPSLGYIVTQPPTPPPPPTGCTYAGNLQCSGGCPSDQSCNLIGGQYPSCACQTQGKCDITGKCATDGTGISCTIGQDDPCGQTRCQGFAGQRRCVLGSYDFETCNIDADCNPPTCSYVGDLQCSGTCQPGETCELVGGPYPTCACQRPPPTCFSEGGSCYYNQILCTLSGGTVGSYPGCPASSPVCCIPD